MLKKLCLSIVLCSLLLYFFASPSSVVAWSNGAYSSDPSNPNYGTHDWIAQHALDWLPHTERQFITDNLTAYLYGTELPDNREALDGIGDTYNHIVYYSSAGTLMKNSSADRASDLYALALTNLKSGDFATGVKYVGAMSHYIADLASFGHVMGKETDWGAEVKAHHNGYEEYVNGRTSTYVSEFNSYLIFDGELAVISAYDAALELAYDTTFDIDGNFTCVWMDRNYDYRSSNPDFNDRCGESLNLAVNCLADVLHTLWLEAGKPIPEFNLEFNTVLILSFVVLIAVTVLRVRLPHKHNDNRITLDSERSLLKA